MGWVDGSVNRYSCRLVGFSRQPTAVQQHSHSQSTARLCGTIQLCCCYSRSLAWRRTSDYSGFFLPTATVPTPDPRRYSFRPFVGISPSLCWRLAILILSSSRHDAEETRERSALVSYLPAQFVQTID